MSKRLVAAITATVVLAASMLLHAQPSPRARVKALRPAADTDVVLRDIIVAADQSGRTRVIMEGSLPKDRPERYFWMVDRIGGQYWVLKLTDNVISDAARVRNLYRKFGQDISLEHLAFRLLPETERQRELREAFEAVGVRPIAERIPEWEERERAQIVAAGLSNVRNINGAQPASFVGPTCDDATPPRAASARWPVSGNTRRSNLRLAQWPSQWSSICWGLGMVAVMTYEPAKYLFPVEHLNETNVQAGWHITNGVLDDLQKDGDCWANEETFANTHWWEESCTPFFQTGMDSFTWAKTGVYKNQDFLNLVFGAAPTDWIGVQSTAALQRDSGGPYWGYEYQEIGTPLVQFWPSWLLTGVIVSSTNEQCDFYCNPSSSVIEECEVYYGGTWDYEQCDCRISPILIDRDRDGFALTDPGHGVTFDILANGRPVQTAWTAPGSDDGFLAMDRNGNGTIDDASELFGTKTPQPNNSGAKNKRLKGPNGFLALAVYDTTTYGGDRDGWITEADAVFSQLRLWTDDNHNGISEPAELARLADIGLRAISLRYATGKEVDEFGNVFGLWSHVVMDRDFTDLRPLKRRAVDVFFGFIPFGTTTAVPSGIRTL